MTWDAVQARARSVEELARFGIAIPEALPLLFDPEDLERLRPAGDAIARALALYAVVAIKAGAPRELVLESLEERDLLRRLSERERRFAEGGAEEREVVEMSWRVEALTALGWALGLIGELPLTGDEGSPASAFAPLDPDGSRGALDEGIALRPAAEIADRLDVFYCAHWAAREQQLRASFDPWPGELVPGAIWERRHGLEWLFTEPGTDWEDVDLST